MATSQKSSRTSQRNEIEIYNFKSIRNIKFQASRVNIFIGRPNSGKSNLLEALTLFNFIQEKKDIRPNLIRYNTLDNLFYDRNIRTDIQINFKENTSILTYFENAHFFIQLINPSADYFKARKSFLKQNLSFNEVLQKASFLNKNQSQKKYPSKFAVINNEGRISQTASSSDISESPVRRYEFRDGMAYNDLFSGYLKQSGENLFTIVENYPEVLAWVSDFYDEFKLEFLVDFSSMKFEIQKKQKGIVYKIPFELTPDTFRRMLFHIAAIHSNKNSVILLEEPESHSFPAYIKELSDLIKADTENTYFITTHSPYFFNSMVEDSKKIKDISFFHVYYKDYETQIKKLTQKDLDVLWSNGADVFFNIDALNK